MSVVDSEICSLPLVHKDCYLVHQNAKISVLQRMIEKKKARKKKRSKGVLRDSTLITENEEMTFFLLRFSIQ
jgi:hypothetical protein